MIEARVGNLGMTPSPEEREKPSGGSPPFKIPKLNEERQMSSDDSAPPPFKIPKMSSERDDTFEELTSSETSKLNNGTDQMSDAQVTSFKIPKNEEKFTAPNVGTNTSNSGNCEEGKASFKEHTHNGERKLFEGGNHAPKELKGGEGKERSSDSGKPSNEFHKSNDREKSEHRSHSSKDHKKSGDGERSLNGGSHTSREHKK